MADAAGTRRRSWPAASRFAHQQDERLDPVLQLVVGTNRQVGLAGADTDQRDTQLVAQSRMRLRNFGRVSPTSTGPRPPAAASVPAAPARPAAGGAAAARPARPAAPCRSGPPKFRRHLHRQHRDLLALGVDFQPLQPGLRAGDHVARRSPTDSAEGASNVTTSPTPQRQHTSIAQ
jgi:hypothetical protein